MRRFALDERGSTLLLTIFYGALALAVVLVVIAATSLYLERKRLFTLADGAALVGAESFALDDVEITPDGARASLNSADVASAVRTYVADNQRGEFTGLQVDQAETPDGRSATVTLSSYWSPPVVNLLVPDGFRIEVTSVARSMFE